MIFTNKEIFELEKQMNFNRSNLEKVIRLIDVLEFIFTKSEFKDVLILKGGTAINLIYTNLKRLSVDIDLDYHGTLDRAKTLEERVKIMNELDSFMIENGYGIDVDRRDHFALISRSYKYTNVSGNIDYIKVDINFMDRISLLEKEKCKINYFKKSFEINTLQKEELYGMKLSALLNRGKPRDLFDSDVLFSNISVFDINKLRKCTLFYLSLDEMFDLSEMMYRDIRNLTYYNIKKELAPVLSKGYKFDVTEVANKVIYNVKELLTLTEQEKEYLKEFSRGNFNPNLLFDEEIASRASLHPMARWKALNINKN